MKKGFLLIVVGTIAAAGALTVALASQRIDPDAKPKAEEVERRVMSPFCPGVLLADCQSRQSGDLKERIGEKVTAGWNNRQIDSWLVSNYGSDVLANPRGFLPWAIPAAVVLIGAFILLTRRGPDVAPVTAEPVGPDDRARVNAELAQFAREQTE
jgi:cytochrome c-type biogenesis protein CcmH